MNTFWSHTIWYLLLLASSIGVIVVTAVKSENRKFTTAFSLAVLGFTYWIEVSLLIILDAYTYYPMLTPRDPFQDAVLGNIFSQVSVSSTAVLFCVLGLRSRYIFIFAGIYYLIDLSFVRLGIYEHNWYRSIYTLIGFIAYCWIAKKWYLWLTQAPPNLRRFKRLSQYKFNKWLNIATLFLAVFAAAGNSILTIQKVAGLQIFQTGIFADMSKDHTSTSMIYGPILIFIMIALHHWKRPFVYKAGVLLLLLVCHWLLYMVGILIVHPAWFIFAITFNVIGFYLWTVLLDRLLAKPSITG